MSVYLSKKGQISVEYLIVIGFLVFLVLSILGIALVYANEIQDAMRLTQLERFAKKVTNNAEAIYYAGEPSKTTIATYLPTGVTEITVYPYQLVVNITTVHGTTRIGYTSTVPLYGSISTKSGIKNIQLLAQPDNVTISSS